MPGIAPPAKTYRDLLFLRADDRRTATSADYANEFPCCGRAFDFDRYHLRHFEVFSVVPFNMTSGRHASRWLMIVRGDQIVANCTAGELKQRTFAMASVVSAERINRRHSPVWLATDHQNARLPLGRIKVGHSAAMSDCCATRRV